MVAADAVLVVRLAATAAPATTPVAAVARVAPAPAPGVAPALFRNYHERTAAGRGQ